MELPLDRLRRVEAPMSISVGADWDMPRRDRAQIELRRLPLLLCVDRGLALDRFADLTSRARVAVKRRETLHPAKPSINAGGGQTMAGA